VSHFTRVKTTFTNQSAIIASLIDMGYTKEQIEVHETAQRLYGYKGDLRPESAEIIIRRKHITSASNDVGFKKSIDGTWEAIISQYDTGTHKWNRAAMIQFKQGYGQHTVELKFANALPSVKRRVKSIERTNLTNGKRRVRVRVS